MKNSIIIPSRPLNIDIKVMFIDLVNVLQKKHQKHMRNYLKLQLKKLDQKNIEKEE